MKKSLFCSETLWKSLWNYIDVILPKSIIESDYDEDDYFEICWNRYDKEIIINKYVKFLGFQLGEFSLKNGKPEKIGNAKLFFIRTIDGSFSNSLSNPDLSIITSEEELMFFLDDGSFDEAESNEHWQSITYDKVRKCIYRFCSEHV